jgi:hypothetical protein
MSMNHRQNPVIQNEVILIMDPNGGGGSGLRSEGVGGRGFNGCSLAFGYWIGWTL